MARKLKIEPPIRGIFESVRGFKYSFHEAISDLVDNSVDADATIVQIAADKDRILIYDNGNGMDFDELEGAVTPWKKAGAKRSRKERGKYGIGLKSAGFSLGGQVIIHTKKPNNSFYSVILDFDKLTKMTGDELDYETEPSSTWKASDLKKGTIIEIGKTNRRKITDDAVQGLKHKLGLSFFRMIERNTLKLLINGAPVEPLHPLLPSLKKNKDENWYQDYPEKKLEFKENGKATSVFTVKAAYIGRGSNWTNEEKKKFRYFLRDSEKEDITGREKTKIADQGLYIVRNDRLITQGGWFGSRPLSHHHSPFRVLVEYESSSDEVMGIDHTKTKPELERAFIDKLNASYIDSIFSELEDRFRDEGKNTKVQLQKKHGDKNIKRAMSLKAAPADIMMETEAKRDALIPEYLEEQRQIDKEVAELIQDQWILLVDKLPFENLWAPKLNKDGEVALCLNERHPGYDALWGEEDPTALTRNLNIFFLLLATYEAHFATLSKKLSPSLKSELEKQFESFRRYVSKHFREFD